jgi:V-type H+-transporting ATPase subunit a
MSFAICLQVPNHLHFKKYLNIYAEFIPQILFMWSIFGYLVVCIIYKWSPGLLNMLIYMFLSPGTVDPKTQLYAGQGFIQVVLLLIALVCVPWMLCLKPYMLYKEHQRIVAQGYHGLAGQENGHNRVSTSNDLEEDEEGAGQAVAEPEEDEHVSDSDAESEPPLTASALRDGRHHHPPGHPHHRVLSRMHFQHVSHPRQSPSLCLRLDAHKPLSASYLRLWALSLAHAQLSEVLYTMTIENAFLFEGNAIAHTIFLVIMFAMWFTLTLAILCVMEVGPPGSSRIPPILDRA